MTKAIFYVGSPLQLLCGIEAQHHYNLEHATYIIVTDKNSRSRQQILKIAERYKIRYKILNNFYLRKSFIFSLLYMLFFFLCRARLLSYQYVFLGDACEKQLTIYSLLSIRRKGVFIYLDDGVATIAYIKNGIPPSKTINTIRDFLKKWLKFKDKIFFTTYYEFPERNFSLVPNKFEYLHQSLSSQQKDNSAYIIGPPIDEYCRIMNIATDVFFETLIKLFKEIKSNVTEKIIYIPHRRDVNAHIERICKEHEVSYSPLDEPVETYFLEAASSPEGIYGFSSSALYTLKMFFPTIEVKSICFNNDTNPILSQLNECFANKGIQLVNYRDIRNPA